MGIGVKEVSCDSILGKRVSKQREQQMPWGRNVLGILVEQKENSVPGAAAVRLGLGGQ